MEISAVLINFIQENKILINQNTKESWEEIYKKLEYKAQLKGEFTEILLDAGIDPAKILGYIPEYYLYKSSNKKYIISDTITSVGDSAFEDCLYLTSIEIPSSVTSIGNWAFHYCFNLTRVEIGDSVTTIGDYAFYNCGNLTSVYITDITAWCNISFGDYYANPLYNAKSLYLNNKLVTDLVIPNTVTKIKDYAFYGCSSLTSITIPNSVTSIGERAFNNCDSLTSVVIGESVTSIGYGAFYGCTNLKEIQYKGTKEQAIKYGIIGDKNQERWRENSSIEKIICIDGVIEL